MENFVRYFLTSRFGRGKVETSTYCDGSSMVEIRLGKNELHAAETAIFYAPADVVALLNLAGTELLFCISRIGIAQAQRKLASSQPCQQRPALLNVGTSQWNGDLLEVEHAAIEDGGRPNYRPSKLM